MTGRRHRTRLLSGCLLAALVSFLPAAAHAQEAVERAREEFRAGVELSRSESWAEAEAAFRRAYALYPDPVIIFNLAGARARLGRLLEARSTYEEFLDRATEEHATFAASARAELSAIEERVGRIDLRIDGAEDGDIVQVDGRTVDLRGTGADGTGADGTGADGTGSDGTGADGTGADGTVEADPGQRVVIVRRGTAELARETVSVPEGGRISVDLVVVNPERLVVVEREADNDDAIIVGALVGAAAVLAAAATVTAIVLTQEPATPFEGNVEPGVVTVPLRFDW